MNKIIKMFKMNKKGFFISLSAMLILLTLIFMTKIGNGQALQEQEMESWFREYKSVADYSNDLEKIYLPRVIGISQKFALQAISENTAFGNIVSLDEIRDVMMTGNYKTIPILPINYQLPELIDRTKKLSVKEFSLSNLALTITDIYHENPFSICTESQVNFEITAEGMSTKSSKSYKNCISINGFNQFVTVTGANEKIRLDLWIEEPTETCYLKTIYPVYNCGTINGVCYSGGC